MLTERYARVTDTPKFYGMIASDIQYLVGGRAEVYYIPRYGEVHIAVKNDDIGYCQMSITLERYLRLSSHNLFRKFLQLYDTEMRTQYNTLLKLRKGK